MKPKTKYWYSRRRGGVVIKNPRTRRTAGERPATYEEVIGFLIDEQFEDQTIHHNSTKQKAE